MSTMSDIVAVWKTISNLEGLTGPTLKIQKVVCPPPPYLNVFYTLTPYQKITP